MTAVLSEKRGRAAVLPFERPQTRHLELYRPGAATHRAQPSAHAGRARVVSSPAGKRPLQRIDPSVYRRRRLLAGGLLLLSVAAVLVLVQLISAGIGGGPLTATGAAAGPGMIPAGATEYVVRPGDTLWTIASSLAPGRDERPLVDQLSREVGDRPLYPGQVLTIPTGR